MIDVTDKRPSLRRATAEALTKLANAPVDVNKTNIGAVEALKAITPEEVLEAVRPLVSEPSPGTQPPDE